MKDVLVGQEIGDREASWKSGQGTGFEELRLVAGNREWREWVRKRKQHLQAELVRLLTR